KHSDGITRRCGSPTTTPPTLTFVHLTAPGGAFEKTWKPCRCGRFSSRAGTQNRFESGLNAPKRRQPTPDRSRRTAREATKAPNDGSVPFPSALNQALSILLPFLASLLYVAGALLVKRCSDFGVGLWRMAFLSNLISALIFQLLLPLGGAFHLQLLWQPALVGLLYLLGQLLNYLALQRGDVSVATPVLGVKIILVALFTTLILKQAVPAKLWEAAALSTVAIALLN